MGKRGVSSGKLLVLASEVPPAVCFIASSRNLSSKSGPLCRLRRRLGAFSASAFCIWSCGAWAATVTPCLLPLSDPDAGGLLKKHEVETHSRCAHRQAAPPEVKVPVQCVRCTPLCAPRPHSTCPALLHATPDHKTT